MGGTLLLLLNRASAAAATNLSGQTDAYSFGFSSKGRGATKSHAKQMKTKAGGRATFRERDSRAQ